MEFEIVHEFEASLDALELAVLSPNLIDKLAPRLPNVEQVRQTEHTLENGVLTRVLSYQADVKIPAFARGYVTREMCAWDERFVYTIKSHWSEWTILPKIKREWRKHFGAAGTYALVASPGATTKRIVKGSVAIKAPPGLRHLAERMIVNEVRKIFDAEADILRGLATLV